MSWLKKSAWCVAACALTAQSSAAQTIDLGMVTGVREPAVCEPLTQAEPPSVEQAIQLARCGREETNWSGDITLMENAKVQIGRPVHWLVMNEQMQMTSADPDHPVYPIRGSFALMTCKAPNASGARACSATMYRDGNGACWKTSFDDWKCFLMTQ